MASVQAGERVLDANRSDRGAVLIDHSAEAAARLELRETTVVILASPQAGTL